MDRDDFRSDRSKIMSAISIPLSLTVSLPALIVSWPADIVSRTRASVAEEQGIPAVAM
jgi:hypothetical protein